MGENMNLLMILVPALPLTAAVLIGVLGPRVLRHQSHWPVILGLLGSFGCSLALLNTVRNQPAGYEHVVSLWTWADIGQAFEWSDPVGNAASAMRDFRIDIVLRADALTCIMLSMVTLISSLVAIYSVGYMKGDRGYSRFFAYIGLFVFSMTMLVSVSNFLLLFVFWEAVGLCSYLLIGFWFEKPAAAAAGRKAFLVNRIGDFGFMLGIFLLWTTYGTLNYHDLPLDASSSLTSVTAGSVEDVATAATVPVAGLFGAERIAEGNYVGGTLGTAICLLLLLGACGKSAQFPLHVWLPDAMEGPTPVSALIHAATMVTAGIYMVARCTPLFVASPDAQLVVAGIGGFTALLAGLIALTQFDLKRVLAYSTISQLGYMFLALGVGTLAGVSAGMFHLFTHAFFKALLFLGAGSVMHAMGNVIDMRRFGGLRHLMPYTFWTFLIGCLALSGIFPLSGFWSKDAIVAAVHTRSETMSHELSRRQGEADPAAETEDEAATAGHSAGGSPPATLEGLSDAQLSRGAWAYHWLYLIGIFTAFLTAFYTFRAFLMTFFGPLRVPAEAGHHAHESPRFMVWPLVILAVFAAGVGLVLDESLTKGSHPFAELLAGTPSLTGSIAQTAALGEFHFSVAATSTLVALGGLLAAAYFYLEDQREIRWLQSLMDLQWLTRASDTESVVRWGDNRVVQQVQRGLGRVGLGWTVTLVVELLRLFLLVISAPLLLGRFVSPYRLSFGKFFFDELYDVAIVRPIRLMARFCDLIDQWVVDGLVNLAGRVPLAVGALMRSMQTGLVQFYALGMLLGALVLILAVDKHLAGELMRLVSGILTGGGGAGSP